MFGNLKWKMENLLFPVVLMGSLQSLNGYERHGERDIHRECITWLIIPELVEGNTPLSLSL